MIQPTAPARLAPSNRRFAASLLVVPLLVAMACAGLVTGCLPTGDGTTDGVVTEGVATGGVAEAPARLEVQFLWPDDAAITDDGVQFAEPTPLALRVSITNHGRSRVTLRLDDLTMRPVPQPGDAADEGFVEAVYRAPGALPLEPGATRILDFGEVRLFFGFACTVHLTGAFDVPGDSAGPRTVAVSHDSRPILLDF